MITIENQIERYINCPQISIIIPCYNIDKYLSNCIESVLGQTFVDFELILINDGSTDNTLNICEQYAKLDNRIRVYSHENKGVSYTRNRGIELAQGNYIMFIDGDDYVKNDMLEHFTFQLKKDSWPMCGMLLVDGIEEEERSNYKELLKKVPEKIVSCFDIFRIISHHNLSTPCCRLYDKKILKDKQIRFYEFISYQEDFIFNLEYCKHIKEVILLDYYGYYYVKHASSSTSIYHKYFEHIDLLFDLLKKNSHNAEDIISIKQIIFDTVLKKLANEFHENSKTSIIKKRKVIKIIVQSDYFKYIYNYIIISSINPIFKVLLLTKNSYLLLIFFCLKFKKIW